MRVGEWSRWVKGLRVCGVGLVHSDVFVCVCVCVSFLLHAKVMGEGLIHCLFLFFFSLLFFFFSGDQLVQFNLIQFYSPRICPQWLSELS